MILARIDNRERPRKVCPVHVFKQEVYDDIDRFTYKWMEASNLQAPAQQDAVSSDTDDKLDGKIISRLVSFRDAKLRKKIVASLVDVHDRYANDVITLEEDKFKYFLSVDPDFNENLLQPIAEYFHRFLVWGALFDWYGSIGLGPQAEFYKRGLDEVTADITNALRTPSIVKKPLQPFGPAKMPL